jgi:ferric-dicitrate binding protein FerR (iron transport regulator)
MMKLILLCGILVFFGTGFLAALNGEITYAEGSVAVQSAAGTVDAEIGMTVRQGDVIRTGADALAVIRLGKGREVKMREKTVLALSDLGDPMTVQLVSGGVFSRVVKGLAAGYRVKTESVVAGVRGTEFFVAFGRTIDEKPDLWLCVNSGSVTVEIPSTNDVVQVNEGEGISIVGGITLTKPRPYPWTRGLNWNMDPSQGKVLDTTSLEQAYSDLLDQDYD